MNIFKAKKRISPIKLNQLIEYKEINLLKIFITQNGKILSRRSTNLTVKQQKELTKAIKCARILSLLPFTINKKK